MAKHFLSNEGEIRAKVFDKASESNMTLRRLKSFKDLKSNIYF